MFFDLDGTLWDASESTSRAWSEVFHKWKLGVSVSSDQIRSVAGKPYMKCLEIIAPQVLEIQSFQNILTDLTLAEKAWMDRMGGRLYPYVLEGLQLLSEKYALFLVSNCNGWYLEAFLRHSKMADIFKETVCFGNTGLKKSENIKNIMRDNSITAGFYIGDTVGDKASAEEAGLTYLHARYGFGGSAVESENQYEDFRSIVQYLNSVKLG